ncbi:adenosylmethionine--8-amino-7-oxononanoate transaminase [Spongorhabdus nitratireducens]
MNSMITREDMAFDADHIWHPYTSTVHRYEMYPVVSAEGVRIKLADGRELIDGMSSWWCQIHGYQHPEMNAALHQQVDTMSHVMFGGLTHKPAIDLARKLVDMTPEGLETVFFADSGSVSVEVAIKMAVQYQLAKGCEGKRKILTVNGGYYGDTTGAMALCDPVTGMHHYFTGLLPQHFFVSRPSCRYGDEWNESCMEELEQHFERHHEDLAAVIIEPVVQGAGGMYFYHPEYVRRTYELCQHYGVLLICDEIATGFGRTGTLFASEMAGITPDIMCVGKALTGGYMTMAATICTGKVSQTISEKGPMMHGPTFMANPLACAAGNASLSILQRGEWKQQVADIEKGLQSGLAPCADLQNVAEVRVIGGIGVVELKQPVDMKRVQPLFVEEGIWVRPFGKLVYIMPPYVISPEDLATLCAAMCRVVSRI